MQAIKVQVRELYGSLVVYPACERAQLFARIAGTKTLTTETLRTIEAIGFTIEIEQPRITRA